MADPRLLRYLAFYLPQYHPIPENDEWWGKGFTDWTNVVEAQPLFRGHRQPHVARDLGFYDLRVAESRAAQAELAARSGLSGFCYFHYWFEGRRLLQRPFEEVLHSNEPDFPFCLCWANENWTRVWDGKAKDMLVPQTYSSADDLRHIRCLAEAFGDARYLRVGGRPLLLVYRVTSLPDAARTADVWRAETDRLGLGDLYLCAVQGGPDQQLDPARFGFDAAVQFAPFHNLRRRRRAGPVARAFRKHLNPNGLYRRHRIYDYADVIEDNLAAAPDYKLYPGVTPGFDNSPRRPDRGATIIVNSTPSLYERWLRAAVSKFEPYSPDENLLFVNAFNEWAEGNHLEPCRRWETEYLDVHARLLGNQERTPRPA